MLRAGRVTVHIHTGTFQLLPSCLSPGTAALSHSIHQWIPSSTVSPDAATHPAAAPTRFSDVPWASFPLHVLSTTPAQLRAY